MEQIPTEYWDHARRIVADEATEAALPAAAWHPFRRLHAELARRLDPFRAQALLQIALGLASQSLPSLGEARVGSDGGLEGDARLDRRTREALLACALGLTSTLLGSEAVLELLGVVWPDRRGGG